MNKPDVIIYTDGSSRGNPGPGGFGTLLMAGTHRKEIAKGFKYTTNNRMELMAVIAGLEALKKDNMKVMIFSDSKYIVDAVEKGWLKNWIRTGFKGGKKNKDLWLRYDELAARQQVKFTWVKGHADNPFNNHCDELATAAADGHHLETDTGYQNED
ncbi:MAG: ribonuclease HI [Terrimonas sp.]|nr:ribonuclease HI [Terrimonas sp.]